MSYAETQQEIIRALRGRSPAIAPPPAQPPARVRLLQAATPAPRPVPAVRAAATPLAAGPVPAHVADDADADSDLAVAVAAARRLRFSVAIEQIAAAAGVTVDQVRGSSRTHGLVEVRRIIAAYLRRRRCSLPEIGRLLNRDHTSVLHLLRVPAKAAGLYEEVAS